MPYGLLALCLLVVWFAAYGQPADVAVDRAPVPWYRTKQALARRPAYRVAP